MGEGPHSRTPTSFGAWPWGALLFGELASADKQHKVLVLVGSTLMILGASAISTAVASSREQISNNLALEQECDRYHFDYLEVFAAQSGEEFGTRNEKRRWWDVAIVLAATCVFLWLGIHAVAAPIFMNVAWVAVLAVLLSITLVGAGWTLWRNTRFS